MNATRSRWATIGAAVAVTLGAGGVGISQATTDSGDGPVSAFFPIEPCRLADTRPAPNTVGPRTSPLGPGETETFSGWDTVGDCTLPPGTSGLSLNVTAVGATAQTNLRFFPADSDVPTAANLNPTPGSAPTPNAVNVALDGAGEFAVFNAFGSVAVIVDVVGYYDDHTHDDRYYTKDELDGRLRPEVIVTDGFDAFTFDAERSFDLDETVTTERSGYLMVSKYLRGFFRCTLDGVLIYFITVDGEPLRSSALLADAADPVETRLHGITELPIPAGEHTIGIAGECLGDSFTQAGATTTVSSATVVVLPD